MKPSEIISLARRQTWCTEDIVTTDEAYKFLNFVIEDFGSEIRTSDSWYWFNTLTISVTAGNPTYTYNQTDWEYMQGESYPIWQPYPISKIQSVWLKDKDGKRYDLPVHFVDKVDLKKFVSLNWPRACFITNNELNLIPTPKEDTEMQIWGWSYNWELWYDEKASAWMDDEADIFIPKRWHYILVEWLKYRMYWNMWVNFEAARTNSRAFYDSEKNKAIQNIVDRWQLADTAYFPNLNFLNY